MISILFLAAEPTDTARLRLGEEVREIQERLQLAKARDNFTLYQRFSVRPADISQALLDLNPHIVHFAGHGTATGEICVEDRSGKMLAVQPDALAALFENFANQVDCVLLNACYSETQAQAIGVHINYVIGMNKDIGDKAAIAFAVGFYQALGAGRPIVEAYKLGCVQIRLQGISEHLTPVLIDNCASHLSTKLHGDLKKTSGQNIVEASVAKDADLQYYVDENIQTLYDKVYKLSDTQRSILFEIITGTSSEYGNLQQAFSSIPPREFAYRAKDLVALGLVEAREIDYGTDGPKVHLSTTFKPTRDLDYGLLAILFDLDFCNSSSEIISFYKILCSSSLKDVSVDSSKLRLFGLWTNGYNR